GTSCLSWAAFQARRGATATPTTSPPPAGSAPPRAPPAPRAAAARRRSRRGACLGRRCTRAAATGAGTLGTSSSSAA
ncbi:hypothetical protein MNEG_15830, partial [Monoraphidium neglectum]